MEELHEFCDYLSRQYSDGWGESFEQYSIRVDGGELYLHFWQCRDEFVFQLEDGPIPALPREINERLLSQPTKPDVLYWKHDKNINSVLARASRSLKEIGRSVAAEEMIQRVFGSKDQNQGLAIISEYVNLKQPLPHKIKRRSDRKTR